MAEIRLPEIQAEIETVFTDRKTVSVKITDAGKVRVSAPRQMTPAQVVSILQKDADRINKMLARFRELQAEDQPPLTGEEIRALAEAAVQDLPPRVQHYAALLGVQYGRISVRCQRTRWGSCSQAGNLSFNCLLMLMPPEIRDSVVVHELCHRLEMNHSKAFYALVNGVFPDYARCAAWLKAHGPAIMRRMR